MSLLLTQKIELFNSHWQCSNYCRGKQGLSQLWLCVRETSVLLESGGGTLSLAQMEFWWCYSVAATVTRSSLLLPVLVLLSYEHYFCLCVAQVM